MGEEKTPPSWWTTLPGVITALAGLLTAAGALLIGLNKAGIIGATSSSAATPTVVTDTAKPGVQKPDAPKADVTAQQAAPKRSHQESLAKPPDSAKHVESSVAPAQPPPTQVDTRVKTVEPSLHPARAWTHTVRIGDFTLQYDSADGSAEAIRDGAVIKSYPAGGFAPGWTNIVWTPHGTLFYNSHTGHGSVVRFDNNGSGNTIKAYPSAGLPSFATGWTDITLTRQGIEFSNAVTGAHAVGEIDSQGNFRTLRSN